MADFRTLTCCSVLALTLLAACEREQKPLTAPSLRGPLASLQDGDAATTQVPDGAPAPPSYVESSAEAGIQSHAPIIRTYKNFDAWFGENRDNATLLDLGKILGDDYFVHPLSALAAGVPAGTSVVLITSNGFGDPTSSAQQSSAAAQASLAAFLATGGVLIVDMGDNDFSNGYRAPGATGTPDLIFPSPEDDATLAPAAVGPDGVLGTADDHPIVMGPDGLPGTADDLTNSSIASDFFCCIEHGNLAQGLTLPADATVLATAMFGGVARPVMAEYDFNGGHVILETFTKEFVGWVPSGTGPSRFLTNLLFYALTFSVVLEVEIDIKPGSDPNSINCTAENEVIAVAILTTDDFDATTVDHTTVTFEEAGETHIDRQTGQARRHEEDVDGDGDIDLVLHFRLGNTTLACDSTEGELTGETFDGQAIRGTGSVRMVDAGQP